MDFTSKDPIEQNTNLSDEEIDYLVDTPDQERHDVHDDNLCMLCHAYGADKRSLNISAFYRLKEFLPEAINLENVDSTDQDTYYLRICKHCRAELFQKLREWREEAISRRDKVKNHDGQLIENKTSNKIYVRINGESVPMTKEQYEKFQERGE